eukprot:6492750-Amphidinium_carterae.2
MPEYLKELRACRRRLEKEDRGTTISDVSFSRKMLRCSGLNSHEQRSVLAAAGATWDATAIESALLLMHGDAHTEDKRRLAAIKTYPQRSTGKGNRTSYPKGKGKEKSKPFGVHYEEEVTSVEGEECDEEETWTEDIPEDDQWEMEEEEGDEEPTDEYQEGDDEILEAFYAAKAKMQKRGLRPPGKAKGSGRSTGKSLEEKKKTSKCSDCGKLGHWRGDPVCEKVKTGQTQPFKKSSASSPQTVMLCEHVGHSDLEEVLCLSEDHVVPIYDVYMMNADRSTAGWEIVPSVSQEEWAIQDCLVNRGVQTDETYILDMKAGKPFQRLVTVLPSSSSHAETPPSVIPDDVTDLCLLQYTVAQLKTWLREHGMSTSGNKDKLIERILEHQLQREIMTDQSDCAHVNLTNGGNATHSWKRCKDCKKIVHRVHKVTGVEEHLVGVCQAERLLHEVTVPSEAASSALAVEAASSALAVEAASSALAVEAASSALAVETTSSAATRDLAEIPLTPQKRTITCCTLTPEKSCKSCCECGGTRNVTKCSGENGDVCPTMCCLCRNCLGLEMCACCWDTHYDTLQIPSNSTCCECGSSTGLTACPGSVVQDCSCELCATCVGMHLCQCCRELGQREALVVHSAVDEVVHSVTIANTTKLESVVADSGCRRNVAGSSWHERMRVLMQEHGLCPQRVERIEKFRFGDERIEQSTHAWQYPVRMGNSPVLIVLDVAEVSCACPALLSNGSMETLKVILDFDKMCVTSSKLQLCVPLTKSTSGHPVIDLMLPSEEDRLLPSGFRLGQRESSVLTSHANTELEMLFEHLHQMTVPRHYTRTNLWSEGQQKEPPRSALLGAYTVRGSGVSEWTNKQWELVQMIHKCAKLRKGCRSRDDYLAVMVNQHVPEDDCVLHRDKNNLPGSLNWVRASVRSHGKGHVKGGRIWVADPSGDQPIPKGVRIPEDYQGVRVGRFLNPMEDWIAFDQTQYHCVEPLSGPCQRSSIVLFSPSGLSRLSLAHWSELEHAGRSRGPAGRD